MNDPAHLLANVPVSDAAKAIVLHHLGEPHRRYHDLAHVVEMWRWHNRYGRQFDDIDHQVVASFCLYHDAVYDSRRNDNEKRSVDLWLDNSKDTASEIVRLEVCGIILASANHFGNRCPIHVDDQPCRRCWCLDLDLMRLGSEQFVDYGHQIRAEYDHLSDQQWAKASSRFRAKVMAQSKIFVHDFGDLERQAQRNLAHALVKDWQQLGYL